MPVMYTTVELAAKIGISMDALHKRAIRAGIRPSKFASALVWTHADYLALRHRKRAGRPRTSAQQSR